MTIPANSAAEATPWGSIPVTPVWGSQGGPYTVTGQGANALPVQGPTAAGQPAVANPQLIAGLDGSGNIQAETLNQDLTLLASAARTTTTTSADQTNQNARGVVVYVNVTAASGTGGLQLAIQGKDPVSGGYKTLNTLPTAITATGLYVYELYPGCSTTGNLAAVYAQVLPRTWRIQMNAGDGSSYTYSIGCSLIL